MRMKIDATLRPIGYGLKSPSTLTRRRDILIWHSGRYYGYNEGLAAAIDMVVEGVLNDDPLIMGRIEETLEAYKKLKDMR